MVYSILIKKRITNTSLQQLTTYCTTWPSTHEACPRWRPLVHFGHRREIPSCQLGRTVVLPLLLCFTIFYSILLCCASCFTLICSLFYYVLLHLILMSSLFSSVVFPVLLCSLDFLSLTPSVSSCILCFALSLTLVLGYNLQVWALS